MLITISFLFVSVNAENKKYAIESVHFDVLLTEHGDANITETWIINYEKGEFNRFYKNIYMDLPKEEEFSDIEDLRVTVDDEEYRLILDGSRSEGFYSSSYSDSIYTYEVYFSKSEEISKITVSYTLKLVAGAFTQSTTGTTITSTSVVGTLYYPGGTLDINVPVSQYGTSQASLNIPSFNVASLFPNTEYTVTISLRTAANVGANTVKATLTPSISLATLNYYCHNKLVKYTKLLNDCKAEVPFSVKISNAKNVSTKFDTIKLSLRYTLSASATSSTISLVTKEWNEIPKNDYKSSVLMVPIRNTSIPINTYQSVLVFWAGEAGAKQDIRIGYEYGTSTIEYESYTSCKTKTNERQTYQTPNGLAYLLQDLTGVVYNVK
jgi:hypothetical protein